MAHGVCDNDPRTLAQRRADALGALAAGADRRACGCGSAECSSAAGNDARPSVWSSTSSPRHPHSTRTPTRTCRPRRPHRDPSRRR
ncbi:DUF222 domain-containing protein [Mycobacterium lacus]|nr:DUF222 domain-containing protein [Mycobacterium lacus]